MEGASLPHHEMGLSTQRSREPLKLLPTNTNEKSNRATLKKPRSGNKNKPRLNKDEWQQCLGKLYQHLLKSKKNSIPTFLKEEKLDFLEEEKRDINLRTIQHQWTQSDLQQLVDANLHCENDLVQQRLDKISKRKTKPPVTIPNGPSSNTSSESIDGPCWSTILGDLYEALYTKRMTSIEGFVCDVLEAPKPSARTVQRHWAASGLKELLDENVPPTDTRVQDILVPRPKGNSQRIFTDDEEAIIASLAADLASVNNGLNPDQVRELLGKVLNADLQAMGLATEDNDPDIICADTSKRVLQRQGDFARAHAYPLDPARSDQARPIVYETFVKHLDGLVEFLHTIDPKGCPWTSYADFPASNKFNTDELAPNALDHRRKVCIPRGILQHTNRVFQNTREGDGKVDTHFSLALTTCADGTFCRPGKQTQGAPPPFWIYADKTAGDPIDDMSAEAQIEALSEQTPDDMIEIPTTLLNILCNAPTDASKANKDLNNPSGGVIRATKKGSMLKRIFFDMVCHFINGLPDGLGGPDGKWVIWFLDWHVSRVHIIATVHAFRMKVLIVLLPSKTSIWGQPNDNGPNMAIAQCIADVASEEGILDNSSYGIEDAFGVYYRGLERYYDLEQGRFQTTGENVTTSAYNKTGIHPINYDASAWRNAIAHYGNTADLKVAQLQREGVELAEISWVVGVKREATADLLTDDDRRILDSETWPGDMTDNLVRAHMLASAMLSSYVQDPSRDKSRPPKASCPAEQVALKLMTFNPSSERVRTISNKTPEEETDERSRSLLRNVCFGDGIHVRRKGIHNGHRQMVMKKQSWFEIMDLASSQALHLTIDEVVQDFIVLLDSNEPEAKEVKRQGKRKRVIRKSAKEEAERESKRMIRNERQEEINQRGLIELDGLREANGDPLSKKRKIGITRAVQGETELTRMRTYILDVNGKEMPFHAASAGPNEHAVSVLTHNTLVHAMSKQSKATKQKKKRKQKLVMRRGGDGLAMAYAFQGVNAAARLTELNDEIKALKKSVPKLEANLENLREYKHKNANSYCDVNNLNDVLKGDALKACCVAFGMRISGGTADGRRDEIKAKLSAKEADFETPQEIFEDKLQKLDLKCQLERAKLQEKLDECRKIVDDMDEDNDDPIVTKIQELVALIGLETGDDESAEAPKRTARLEEGTGEGSSTELEQKAGSDASETILRRKKQKRPRKEKGADVAVSTKAPLAPGLSLVQAPSKQGPSAVASIGFALPQGLSTAKSTSTSTALSVAATSSQAAAAGLGFSTVANLSLHPMQAPLTTAMTAAAASTQQHKPRYLYIKPCPGSPICFVFVDVNGDGSCMFHSLAMSPIAPFKSGFDIRRDMYRKLAPGNPWRDRLECIFQIFRGNHPIDIETWRNHIVANSEWGTDFDLVIFACLYQVNVVSYKQATRGRTLIRFSARDGLAVLFERKAKSLNGSAEFKYKNADGSQLYHVGQFIPEKSGTIHVFNHFSGHPTMPTVEGGEHPNHYAYLDACSDVENLTPVYCGGDTWVNPQMTTYCSSL